MSFVMLAYQTHPSQLFAGQAWHALAVAPTPGSISPGPPAPFQVTTVPRRVVLSLTTRGWLESIWVAATILLLAGIAAYAGVFRPLRRGAWKRGWRRRLIPVAAVVATVSLLGLSVAAGVNTYVGYIPTIGALKARAFGDQLPVLPPAAAGKVPRVKGAPQPTEGSSLAAQPTPTLPLPPAPEAAVAPLSHSQVVQLPLRAPTYGLDNAPAYVYLPAGYTPTGHSILTF